jgi:mannosyltransferase
VTAESSSRAWAWIAVAAFLGGVLRFADISAQSLWYDEVYSLRMVSWPLRVILTVRDGHPPLFHLLLMTIKPWLGENAGRVLSAVVGTLTIPLIGVLGIRMFDPRTGAWSALLLALSPLHVWYSREGRMYALYALFAVISSLAVESVVRRRDLRSYLGWMAATFAGLLTHYGFVAVLCVQVLFVAAISLRRARGPRELLPLALIACAGLALVAPLARELLTGSIGAERGFSALGIPYAAFTFLVGFGIGPTLTELHWSRHLSVLRPYAGEIAIAGATLACLGILIVRSLRSSGRWGAYTLLWLVVPPLMLALRSSLAGTSQNVRYVIGSLPAFVLLSGYALRHARQPVATTVFCMVAALSALSIYRDRVDARYQREDVRSAAAFLRREAQAGDRIVVSGVDQRLTLSYYLGRRRKIEKLPVLSVTSEADAAACLEHWRGRPTWVVFSRDWEEDPSYYLHRAILARWPNALALRAPGVGIFRLGR